MTNYTLKLSGDQIKVVRDALLNYMDINSGDLEALLNVPFMQRELTKSESIKQAKRFVSVIKNGLAEIPETGNHFIGFPPNFINHFLEHGLVDGQIQITDQQADFLIKALDCYSRFNTGQLEILFEQPYVRQRMWTDGKYNRDLEGYIDDLKALIGLSRNSSHGIGHPDCPEARQAYDILCVIRHRLYWDRAGNPPQRTDAMFGVYYDKPLRWYKEWSLAEMTRSQDDAVDAR